MRWAYCLILLVLIQSTCALNDTYIFDAFTTVFQFKDQLTDLNTPILRSAYLEFEKMGIDASLNNLCDLSQDKVALILMKAALAEYVLGMKDPNDWNIVVANAETGQLTRKRSFSATRFAVIESLLLVSIIALGRLLWFQ